MNLYVGFDRSRATSCSIAPRSSAHCSSESSTSCMQAESSRKRDFQIPRRHGDEVLSDVLLRVRVLAAAQLRIDRRNLIRAQARASAKRHVLLRMGHSGKPAGVSLPPAR